MSRIVPYNCIPIGSHVNPVTGFKQVRMEKISKGKIRFGYFFQNGK